MSLSRNNDDLFYEDTLSEAEGRLGALIVSVTPAAAKGYADDLALWQKRVTNDLLLTVVRRLRDQGMTAEEVRDALGVSYRRYRLIIGADNVTPRMPSAHPTDYVDISDEFNSLFREYQQTA